MTWFRISFLLSLTVFLVFSQKSVLAYEDPTRRGLTALIGQDPLLKDYALYFLGEVALSKKECQLAARSFEKIVDENQESLWWVPSLRKMAESLECLGKWERGASFWRQYQSKIDSSDEKGRAAWHMALSSYKQEETDVASDLLSHFWLEFPESPWADESLALLKKMGRDSFSTDELFERGKRLCKNGEFEKARLVFSQLNHPEASFWEAESLFRLRRYQEAFKKYEMLYAEEREGAKKKQFLGRMATAAARLDQSEKALQLQQKILKIFPHSEEAVMARRKIAFLYLDAGLLDQAVPYLKQLIRRGDHKTKLWAEEKLAWSYYRLGRWESSLRVWKKIEKGPKQEEALYWQGRIFEKKGELKKSQSFFQKLIQSEGWRYYKFLAAHRLYPEEEKYLKAIDPGWENGPFFSFPNPEEVKGMTEGCLPLAKAFRLQSLGLKKFVGPELARVTQVCETGRMSLKALATLAKISGSLGYYTLPITIAQNWDPFKEGGEVLQWAYPEAYAEVVRKEAHPRKVDPFLVYSMMRQESRFQPEVISPVGARGLLQLMPSTAMRLARKAGWPNFSPELLEEPEPNIKLSLVYLEGLLKEFQGQVISVVASYNAGEEAVRRWRRQKKGIDEEEFVEEIPYDETEDYVKRVMTNYEIYRLLYTNKI
ncbi:MAG: transglycosylase SLT domain-containing protein [Deltaproteobacteria bacterium]|nr:transglycosylase SLT domain-containing protein [Deltaproteobacteria bacterium]